MKITEAARTKMTLQLIEDIAADLLSYSPKKEWKCQQERISDIYKLAHTARNKQCRKNHEHWAIEVDYMIRSEKGTVKK